MAGGANTWLKRARWTYIAVRRRQWFAVSVAWVLTLVALVGVSLTQERFEASARIYVDTQSVLKPLMVGLAYQPDIDQQVRMLARTLISRPNVERLVDQPDLGFGFKHPAEREKVVNRLMGQIRIVAGERGNLYQIFYRDPDRERARKLVDGMVTLFVNSGADGKKRDSVDASRFIDEQITRNEARLTESENRLKDFKLQNFGMSGVSSQEYFTRMSTLSDEVVKLTTDLKAAEQTRDSYRSALAAENPQLPPDTTLPGVPATKSDIDVRLDAQLLRLDELMERYTAQHPDVISARVVVDQLKAQKKAEQAARAKDAAGRDAGAATSPIYQKIRIALVESEAHVAALKAQLQAQQERLARARALVGRAPQVEAELAQLNRDYDVVRKNYDQLVARRESASLGLKMDESSQLAEFRLVEPPRVSPSPVFPGQLHLALMAIVLAMGAGIGAALLKDVLRPTIDGVLDLQQLTGRPVLGRVVLSKSAPWLEKERTVRLRFLGMLGALLVCQALWVLWLLVQPAR